LKGFLWFKKSIS